MGGIRTTVGFCVTSGDERGSAAETWQAGQPPIGQRGSLLDSSNRFGWCGHDLVQVLSIKEAPAQCHGQFKCTRCASGMSWW